MEVVDLKASQLIWAPCGVASDVYREGMLVADSPAGPLGTPTAPGDGVINLGASDGAWDADDDKTICGIVVGDNNRVKAPDTTYGGNQITAPANTQAALTARSVHRADGPWGMDPQGMVQIALIDATTKIKAPIYNSTFGTGPSLLTVTTGSTTGLGFTSNACDFTPIADLHSAYCRSGANRGILRQLDDASTTVATTDVPFPYDIAIGDTFVRVPLRPFGLSNVAFDAESVFVDCSVTPTAAGTTLYSIHVLELNLAEAGKEYVIFRFNPIHFLVAH